MSLRLAMNGILPNAFAHHSAQIILAYGPTTASNAQSCVPAHAHCTTHSITHNRTMDMQRVALPSDHREGLAELGPARVTFCPKQANTNSQTNTNKHNTSSARSDMQHCWQIVAMGDLPHPLPGMAERSAAHLYSHLLTATFAQTHKNYTCKRKHAHKQTQTLWMQHFSFFCFTQSQTRTQTTTKSTTIT